MPIRPENRDRHPSDPGRLRPAGLFSEPALQIRQKGPQP